MPAVLVICVYKPLGGAVIVLIEGILLKETLDTLAKLVYKLSHINLFLLITCLGTFSIDAHICDCDVRKRILFWTLFKRQNLGFKLYCVVTRSNCLEGSVTSGSTWPAEALSGSPPCPL